MDDFSFEIHTVSCERDKHLLTNLISSLRSYDFFKNKKIIIHECLEDKFKEDPILDNIKIFRHEEVESLISKTLENYPNCNWIRQNYQTLVTNGACIKKLFDVYVTLQNQNLLYFDSDILILNEPKEIINNIKNHINFYIKDIQDGYVQTSLDRNDFFKPLNIKGANINSGLYYLRNINLKKYLDFVEDTLNYIYIKHYKHGKERDFLLKKAFSFFQIPWWTEQTILASFLLKNNAQPLDQNKYFIPDDYDDYKSFNFNIAEAIHFAGKTRSKYQDTYLINNFLKNNIYN